jgi:hypothetical protein
MALPPRKGRDEDGNAVYDLSGDEAAAADGDEDAKARLATRARLEAGARRRAASELH